MGRVKDYYHEQINGCQWAEDHQREPLDRRYQSKGQDMNESLSAELHTALAAAAHTIRKELAEKNIGGYMRIDIEIEGRINDGELKVTYLLGDTYGANNAKGARLTPVVSEFLRRKGWNEANEPAALMAPGEFVDEPVAPNYTHAND